MEKSSSSWSRSRSSWLPIREIKTNRRCTLCNCCTICTISKVTHSAKTNTSHPHIHARVQYVSMTRILAESQLQSQSHSQSQFLSWRQQLQLQLVMFTAYHDSFPTPVTPFSYFHLPPTLYFLFHLVFSVFFCSPSSRWYFPFVGYFCFKLSQLFKLSSPSPSLSSGLGSVPTGSCTCRVA